MLQRNRTLLIAALGLVAAVSAPAHDPAPIPLGEQSEAPSEPKATKPKTVDEVVAAANRMSYYQGRDMSAHVEMEIVDAQGRKRSREMTILRRNATQPPKGDNGAEGSEGPEGATRELTDAECRSCEQSFYVRFQHPADVDKTTFMVHKKPGADDERWLYLPALDLVKRVSSADKRSSFVGSNYYYEDVSGRHVDADEHTLVDTSEIYWVVESKPKDAGSVEFASYKMWIHRGSSIVVKVEYKDAEGETFRMYDAQDVDVVQGRQTVLKGKMSDLRTKGSTTVTYTDVKYDVGLPEDLFTERYLRRAPRQFIK